MKLTELYNTLADQHGSKTGEMVFSFSDKGSMHSYVEFYEQYFEPRRDHASLLEIGMMTGGSMHMWQRYFKQYQLMGIDLSPGWNQARDFQAEVENDPNIALLFEINSRSPEIPAAVKSIRFDFVIDDGDHSVLAQIDTFENYWPVLANHGTYFIEDVVGVTQAEALKKFLAEYSETHQQTLKIDHYQGLKNGRADDQIIAVTRG